MSKEAMKLALEAIYSEKVQKAAVILEEALAKQEVDSADSAAWRLGYDAGVARQEAIYESAKQEQSVSVGEPVAWLHEVTFGNGFKGRVLNSSSDHPYADDERVEYSQAKVVSRPLVFGDTTPQQRPSRSDIKPLTRDEVEKLFWGWKDKSGYSIALFEFRNICNAIEAAHGIKE